MPKPFIQLHQAIELLARLSENSERDELELDLQITISAPLLALEGFSSSKVAARQRACLHFVPTDGATHRR